MIPNHQAASLSKLDLQIASHIPIGGNWRSVPKGLSARIDKLESGRTTQYARLRPDRPSYTISTYYSRPGNGAHLLWDQERTLSHREAARLQSFPDSFAFTGTQRQVATQIGNAVPPLLAFQVAKALGVKPGLFIDLFAGAGGMALGFQWAGWRPLIANDIDEAALRTHGANCGGYGLVGDIRDRRVLDRVVEVGLAGKRGGESVAVLGGPPCFPASVSVLTKRGLISIRDVEVGDEVVTHQGRFSKVLRVGATIAPLVRVKGQGHFGIETTADHPFLITRRRQEWDNSTRRYVAKFDSPQWLPAGELGKRANRNSEDRFFWHQHESYPQLPIPQPTTLGREQAVPPFSESFFWIVGFWLAEGWVRIRPHKGEVLFAANDREVSLVRERMQSVGFASSASRGRTAWKISIASKPFACWLASQFGCGAAKKTIPAWAFGMDRSWRIAMLDGHAVGDGNDHGPGRIRRNTVSRRLAVGTTMLLHSVGRTVTVSATKPRRLKTGGICLIENRVVREKTTYGIECSDSNRSSHLREGHRLGLVRKVIPINGLAAVYNLEVEGDNSYLADGIIVHNCQGFSLAGKHLAMDDPRNHLFKNYVEVVRGVEPHALVFENVMGLASCQGGAVLGEICRLLRELGHQIRVVRVEAERHAVPQRRKRLLVVGSPGWAGLRECLHDTDCEEALGDLPAITAGEDGSGLDYRCEPRTPYQMFMRGSLDADGFLCSLCVEEVQPGLDSERQVEDGSGHVCCGGPVVRGDAGGEEGASDEVQQGGHDLAP